MGRKISLTEEFKQYDFVKAAKREGNAEVRVRLLALSQIHEGKNCGEVAGTFKVSQRTVNIWVSRFNNEGYKGLKHKPGQGKKPKLVKERYAEFKTAVKELQNERGGGRIRGSDIKQMLQEKFKLEIAQTTVYDLLRNAGMSWISARSKHPQSNIFEQETFKKTSLKTLKRV